MPENSVEALAAQYEIEPPSSGGVGASPAPQAESSVPPGGTASDPTPAPASAPAPARDGPTGPVRDGPTGPVRELPPRDEATGRFVSPAQHSPTLVRLAFDLGMSPEEIDSLDTASLQSVVRQAQAEQQAMRRSQTASGAVEAGQARAAQARADQPAMPKAAELGLDGELEWDPTLLGLLGSMKKELEESRKELAELRTHHARQQQQTARQELEGIFASKYANFMGPEPAPGTPPTDPAMAKRILLTQHMRNFYKDYKGPIGKLVDDLMGSIFGQTAPGSGGSQHQTPPAPPSSRGPTPEQWREAALARPTHRAGAAEPAGKEKAVQTVARFQRENGMTGTPDPSSLDEFPE